MKSVMVFWNQYCRWVFVEKQQGIDFGNGNFSGSLFHSVEAAILDTRFENNFKDRRAVTPRSWSMTDYRMTISFGCIKGLEIRTVMHSLNKIRFVLGASGGH